jgi:5S rRNA maturation endonuclease (ribonuclease M5)
LLTRLKEKEERILQALERLAEESEKGTLIIVEGKKDVESLRELGVQGEIMSAKAAHGSRLDFISGVEKTGVREVILLLDFDSHGRELTDYLRQHLEKAKIKLDLSFWNELLRVARREVKDVEGLVSYVETLKKKTGEA